MASTQHVSLRQRVVALIDKLSTAGGLVATIVMWLLAATITYDVILRSMGAPTLWASEVSIYLMMAVAFLGIGATQSVDGHFRMTIVRDLCPRPVRALFDLFNLVVCLVFAIGFTFGAWKLISFSLMLNLNTPTILEVPMWILQALLLIGGVLLILANLRDALRFIAEGAAARDAKSSNEVI
jgi:TRAP-type C4-dicarboxylate transport system permease small subunit